ncbi:MAG: cell envelope biogenesis protein OmpA [Flavobacteriales bacterium]|nr:MAG: cell envelope biogenesis protein OmpA [Flavobacteriales bacterium]
MATILKFESLQRYEFIQYCKKRHSFFNLIMVFNNGLFIKKRNALLTLMYLRILLSIKTDQMRLTKQHIIYILIVGTLFSCVPAKKYEELKSRQDACRDEISALKTLNQNLEEENNELKSSIELNKKELEQLKNDVAKDKADYDAMKKSYSTLKETYRLLSERQSAQSSNGKTATDKLMKQLQATQLDLQAQEDALRTLETSLLNKEAALKKLSTDLEAREKRVNELEAIINKKDAALANLKKKVKEALLGFENNGLTIEQKNGKVYVSLDESLLFASGKYDVGSKGTEVLKKLAKVLETSSDIDIVVEGHTDNVPLKGKGDIADNWDLSVKRATSVVKIITNNSNVSPKRLTAAGRGEYLPLDLTNTTEGRKKNRRIEVILTPKLDELFELLGE